MIVKRLKSIRYVQFGTFEDISPFMIGHLCIILHYLRIEQEEESSSPNSHTAGHTVLYPAVYGEQ
jgi:hypothetical protein